MRVSTRGWVTIPAYLRKKAGLLPNMEVDFAYDGKSDVRIFRVAKKSKTKTHSANATGRLRRPPQSSRSRR
jgi:bifunctional DNA-binding transcriptional regulator/antitoxin component of YhaV-PrlF toxin-antitoxin module